MRRLPLLMAAISLAFLLSSCGGGGSSSSSVGSTAVVVTVGNDGTTAQISTHSDSVFARTASLLEKLFATRTATAAIPTNITDIAFTITAPDIQTISRTVAVAGRPTVTETFTVPNGGSRSILVESKDASGVTQYRGVQVVNLDGTPVSLPVAMVNAAPPSFSGLTSATATSSTTVDLAWSPASDNATPASAMTYLVYVATSAGGENFTAPSFTTSPGATSYTLQGLTPATSYFVVVRANDQQGMIDSNVVEKSATTAAATEVTAPTFQGIAAVTRDNATAGKLDLSWSAASDNVTPTSQIVYLIYMSSSPGGENLQSPSFTTPAGVTSYSITGLSLGTYYFIVRARDAAGNMDGNSVEQSQAIGTVTATAGTPQTADVSSEFAIPLKVTVANGPTLPSGVAVTFGAFGGGAGGTFHLPDGTDSSTATVTTVNGVATAPPFTANATTGSYSVIASIGSISTTFSLTNVTLGSITVPADPPEIANDATGTGTLYTTPMQVTVRDSLGNVVPNTGVIFTAPGAGASGTFAGGSTTATVLTDALGVAIAPAFTANGIAGPYLVTATAGGLSANFTRTNF